MFEHAYNGYMKYAYPYDELRPLTCDGVDTWGRYIYINSIVFRILNLFIMFTVIHYH